MFPVWGAAGGRSTALSSAFVPTPSASVRLPAHCVFAVSTDEKQLRTKSEGSDVSPATDQLTEDKHGEEAEMLFHVL